MLGQSSTNIPAWHCRGHDQEYAHSLRISELPIPKGRGCVRLETRKSSTTKNGWLRFLCALLLEVIVKKISHSALVVRTQLAMAEPFVEPELGVGIFHGWSRGFDGARESSRDPGGRFRVELRQSRANGIVSS